MLLKEKIAVVTGACNGIGRTIVDVFIENEIQHQGIDALRWAIVEVEDNVLTLAVSGRKLEKI